MPVDRHAPRPSTFQLKNTNAAGIAGLTFTFGRPRSGSQPIAGDGTTTIGVVNRTTGTWTLRNSNSSGSADLVFNFGRGGAKPVAANWYGR